MGMPPSPPLSAEVKHTLEMMILGGQLHLAVGSNSEHEQDLLLQLRPYRGFLMNSDRPSRDEIEAMCRQAISTPGSPPPQRN
jgi:hypothetical protein